MKLKTLGLLGALVFAVPVAAVAAPAGGLTAQSSAPAMVTQALDTNAAVDSAGPTAKIDKVWWRGGWRGGGWRGGWGWRRPGWGWGGGWGWRRGCCWGGGWGWRRWGWRRW